MDGTEAHREAGLAQLLGDDLHRGIGVQEAVAQDLADRLVGAAVVGFGTGFVGLESGQAALVVGGQQLVVTLAAIAVFLGDLGDVLLEALAFLEHEKAAGQSVAWGNGQGAGWADELVSSKVELES